jgi:thiamine pyrophosphate-dependent acetolactate synthase large subunit-like protein
MMMLRKECLEVLARKVQDEIVVTNLGYAAAWWLKLKPRDANFYLHDSMGMASSVGLGMALALPQKRVIVLDGDGGLLLNLGILITIAEKHPPNLIHLLFDNRCYESSGGQCLVNVGKTDFVALAKGAGIANARGITTLEEFATAIEAALRNPGIAFLSARIEPEGVPMPEFPLFPPEIKYQFQRFVRSLGK